MARPKRVPFSPQLAEYRRRLGLTQEQVADRLNITAEMVRKHERGISMPVARTRLGYCKLFDTSEVELGLRPPPHDSTTATQVPADDEPASENVLAILERVSRLERASIGASSLAMLDFSIDDFINRYEGEGPKVLAGPLNRQRQTIEDLISRCGHPSERRKLYSLAGRTSGLLAYMAVNRGRYPLARAYCTEAFTLGDYAEDPDLQAWVRGTQSFCEYYAGDYMAAVDLARDGARYAGTGPQLVRLAINGEARALAKLGDAPGVHLAVERAYQATDANELVPGVSPCISFGGYSLARTASNAVTAYVDLGSPSDAATHAEIAMPEFEASDSLWSQSLIRLDLAKAIVVGKDGDLEEAAALAHRALTISRQNPIASVVKRSRELLRAIDRKCLKSASVANLRDAVSSTQLT